MVRGNRKRGFARIKIGGKKKSGCSQIQAVCSRLESPLIGVCTFSCITIKNVLIYYGNLYLFRKLDIFNTKTGLIFLFILNISKKNKEKKKQII